MLPFSWLGQAGTCSQGLLTLATRAGNTPHPLIWYTILYIRKQSGWVGLELTHEAEFEILDALDVDNETETNK